MPRPPVTPTGPSSPSKITCTCGQSFKTNSALQQHQRDSSFYRNTAKGSSGTKGSCDKTIKGENGLGEHIRDTARHKLEEFAAGTGARTTEKQKFHETWQYANFRNEETFPTFAGLPGENDINLAYYDTVDGFTYRPRKH
ncbi:uncharacterized protein K444DRAFT_308370 [Hyaloscypha bicolor E]|uniref:Uncharacterized protein n=1 Tax=Hyaloscypha bicolor E TaxID=1095630 RepID=A0A2J6TMP5_9HELO|nr:uncharacterized protein K444DRAFT_308370 [Hyaloscypha bicolor E]PMD64277.1 hypothetical protein K444DRAFT_308370 [Hyaloscypha bicolor E]